MTVSKGITISITMTVSVTISGLGGGSGFGFSISRPFAVMVSKVVSITVSNTMVSVSVVGIAVSITISGLGGGHGGESNKGKSDTLHNAEDYDYVLKSSDGADDLCRIAIPH